MTMLEKLLEAITGLTAALTAHTAALAANPTPAKAAGKKAAAETTAQPAGQPAQATVTQPTPAATQPTASNAATASQSSADAGKPQLTAEGQATGKLMVRVANEISRDAAVAILAKYGATAFAGVKPSDYAAFSADCTAALTPAAPTTGAAGLF